MMVFVHEMISAKIYPPFSFITDMHDTSETGSRNNFNLTADNARYFCQRTAKNWARRKFHGLDLRVVNKARK